MLLQVWGRKGAEDGESGGEGVPRFLRAGAGQPRALLPLQVSPLAPIPRNLLLLQGGRSWRNLLVWASLLALWTVLQEVKTGNSRWTISRSSKGVEDVTDNTRHNLISREEEVAVLWTITQSCIEDYRITLCPQHHQVRIEDNLWWEIFSEGIGRSLLDWKLQPSKLEERRRLPCQDSTHKSQWLWLPLWRLQGFQLLLFKNTELIWKWKFL